MQYFPLSLWALTCKPGPILNDFRRFFVVFEERISDFIKGEKIADLYVF